MGVVESKKDGIVRTFQIKINLNQPIKPELMGLTNWSFPDIKQLYDTHCRKGQCPYIDFFTFHKVMPFTNEVSRNIFASMTAGDSYLNIFELVSILIVMAHNSYRKKLQFIFVLFDFMHQNQLTNRQLILIFQSILNGFCRATGQTRPKYEYLSKYTRERFIRANSLEALEKPVSYRRLIEQAEGNTDCFELFKRFDQEMYGLFTQESYLFRVGGFKKYDKEDVEKIYRVIRKVSVDKNYEQVELVEENKKARLENRKSQCIRQLLEERQQKFKKSNSDLKTRSSSIVINSSRLPSISQRKSLAKLSPSPKDKKQTLISSTKNLNRGSKVLILNGKLANKQDIFETIKYFKSLSGNKPKITLKQFKQSFNKKSFIQKQIGSLYKYFDTKKKGEVNFDQFLKAYYHKITQAQIQIIKEWLSEFKAIHEADHMDLSQNKQKQKRAHVQLPRSTLRRMDEIFVSIDKGNKGYLSFEDLKLAYNTGFTLTELQQMMRDFGNNNKINKDGFIRMTLPENWTIEGTDYVGI